MLCAKCSIEIPDDAKYCSSCGAATGVLQSTPEPQPTSASKPKRAFSKGLLAALLLFVLVTWGGAAGIAFAVSQTAEGPRGEQGSMGARGPAGSAGGAGVSEGSLRILATFFAVDHLVDTGNFGSSLSGSHPQVQACVDYIMDFEGSLTDCGFQLSE